MKSLLFGGLLLWAACAPRADAQVRFNRDVRPILSDKCYTCHGPDPGNRKSVLRFDVESLAKADLGKGRFAIVPGEPDKSEMIRRVTSTNVALRMPPAYAGHAKLSNTEIDTLRQWVREGAQWEGHWSLIPPTRPKLTSSAHPIDQLVQARLAREGLALSSAASRLTLLRRLSLDLTGLPPTPAEVDAFVSDTSPGAYEKQVDRLLASPRYAERMTVRWLDAARYADTNGYQSDGVRDMYRWRDWVINAFQRNMPFDQFTIEQLAGDLLPNPTLDQRIATGFHRNHRTTSEGGIVAEEFRVEYVADRAETTSTVWLGLTTGCARCHDHKYDPITQKDFYRLFAFFNNVPEKGQVYNFGNEEPMIKAPNEEMSRHLAELDSRLASAESAWRALQPKIAKAQDKWEQAISKSGKDWDVWEGLLLHLPLDGEATGLESVAGKIGGAQRFDGKNFLEAGNVARFSYLDPFTIAAWIQPAAADGAILTKLEDYMEAEGYGLYLMDGKLRLVITKRYTDIGLRVETESRLRLNQWQHVLVSYDGNRYANGVSIRIDGIEQKLNVLLDDLNYPLGNDEPLRVGGGGGEKLRFRGAIDDVRIFKIALSPEQAVTVPVLESVSQIAAMPASRRSPGQQAKLRLCFLDQHAPEDIRLAQSLLRQAEEERKQFYKSIPTVMVMKESPGIRDTFMLKRGAYDAPADKVTASVPSALPPMRKGWPENRLGLARWLVDRGNPLTARVTVNRFWQMLFGAGLVRTVEDFGSQGEWPVNPDLLDWLAVEFMENGWNVKQLLKTIVTSATYQQSSQVSPALLEKDPENRLLARGPRFRLPAEMLRDQALFTSGLLVDRIGGPSVKPYQPEGLWQELAGGSGYKADKGEGLYRRSLYTFWRRTVAPPSMVTFDSPNRETCTVRAVRTNTPLQALNLMNDVAYLEASRKLSARMMRERHGTPAVRLAYGYQLVLSREPKPEEAAVLLKAFQGFCDFYKRDREAAGKMLAQGESPIDTTLDPAEHAAYAGVASLILNLDEAVTKE